MDNDAIVDSAAFLTAIVYAIVLTRMILRRLKHEKFEFDDYFMVIALLFYTINTVTYPIILNNGTNIGIDDPRKLSPDAVQQVILGSKWAIVERLSYLTYIWTVKTCILIHFTRLPLGRNSKYGVKTAVGTLSVSWIVCFLASLEECIPLSLAWQVFPDTPRCAKAVNAIAIISVTDIISNIMLMVIPVPIIIRTHLSTSRKIQIVALYLVGVFALLASPVRMIIALNDMEQKMLLIWAQLECFLMTIIANGPVIHGLYRHGFKHIQYRRYRSDSCHMGSLTGDGDRAEGSGGEKREGRARKIWRRVSGCSNPMREPYVIQCTVELVQRSETGIMGEETKNTPSGPGGKDFDIYTGDKIGQLPLAGIESQVAPGTPEMPSRRSRLFGREKSQPLTRKSLITEVD